jgi:hypothetical protein
VKMDPASDIERHPTNYKIVEQLLEEWKKHPFKAATPPPNRPDAIAVRPVHAPVARRPRPLLLVGDRTGDVQGRLRCSRHEEHPILVVLRCFADHAARCNCIKMALDEPGRFPASCIIGRP